ncbi:MAG: diaminopimelate epimerase [Ruminococcaceae bacterium]|nr:diaminopimelate epimerase [Oscillospiraceae bacterium]
MQGAGNDYIYLDRMDPTLPPLPIDPSELARRMSPRHTSVGADGLVLILPSDKADARMRMFNADGSEGAMCGNAIRCVGKYLHDEGYFQGLKLTVETKGGIRHLDLHPGIDGEIDSATVDMGQATLSPTDIPLSCDLPLIDAPVSALGATYHITALSVGNPHAVIFTDDPQALDLPPIGSALEHHPLFPQRVNIEFVRITDPRTLETRVWERGSGETLACGTGACASVVAAVLLGHCPADTPITVRMKGGSLTVVCTSDLRLSMTGDAVRVYDGIYDV